MPGVSWYRVKDLTTGRATGDRFGSLLATDTWTGRVAWVALLVAFAALVVAVGTGGWVRRFAGGMLIAVMAVEGVRRMVLPAEAFFPESSSPFGLPIGATPVPAALLAQVVGAIAGAWLVTTTDAEATAPAVAPGAAEDVDPGPPPSPAPEPPS